MHLSVQNLVVKILLKISGPKLGPGSRNLCVQNSDGTDVIGSQVEEGEPNHWTWGLVNHVLMWS